MNRTRNRARCANCNDVLESKHRHDFVACSCFKNEEENTGIFIDGGQEYFRAGGNFTNLLILKDDDTEVPFMEIIKR